MASNTKIKARDAQSEARLAANQEAEFKGKPQRGKVDPANPMSPPKGSRAKPMTARERSVASASRAAMKEQEARGPADKPMGTTDSIGTAPDYSNVNAISARDLPGNVRKGVTKDAAARERHEQRKGWFLAEAYRQSQNRQRMARCESFYDSEQWTFDDADTLRQRGQDPVVYNEVKPTIDWLMGTERRTRVDFVVMAQDDGDQADDDAALKTKILKYLDDTNLAQFERSWAAEDAFKAGVGWLEVGLRGDKSGTPVYVGSESWRNILWDSQGQRRDLSDSRYLFRIKVVDYDIALALFPDKKDQLDRVIQTGDTLQVFSEWMGGVGSVLTGLDAFNSPLDPLDDVTVKPVDMFNTRKRVLLLECWSREPVPRQLNEEGLGDPLAFRMRVSIMTEQDTLIESWSPFKHDRFPFIPIWAYRNKRTGLPYSPIWPLVGPQESLNKRMSKSLFEANKNQLEMEAGAYDEEIMDVGEIRAEHNDPNGIALYAPGALTNGRVRKVEVSQHVQHQLELANIDRTTIRGVSGVNADNRGENSNVVSGKAVLAKQDQGSLLTAELFDNLLFARKLEGDITLSTVEQYMVAPMTIRVAEGIGKAEKVKINQPVWNMETEQWDHLNDISARQAHFVVGEQAWKQAYAEAAFDSLMEVLTQLSSAAPQAVINLLDLVFDMHPNLPKKRAIVQRIRSINGQHDPDAKLTPEEEAAKEQAQAIAQMQFQLQMDQLKAQVAEAQAKGIKLNADAVLSRLTAIYEAAQAAQVLIMAPQIAPIADQLARSAGLQDLDAGSDQYIDNPSAPPLQVAGQALPPAVPAGPGGPAIPPAQQTDGAAVGHLAGIRTPAPDGVNPGA